MAEFRRPLHNQIARILARMDADFLAKAECYFGGGTQVSLAHGEFRESRDIDFIVSSRAGIRAIHETVTSQSLGNLFSKPILLSREVVTDRDAVRTFVVLERTSKPIKFEIVYEARIDIEGGIDPNVGVPTLSPIYAVAEKFLANTDRGMDKSVHSRDAIDLSFLCLDLDEQTFLSGYQIAVGAYGASVLDQFNSVLKRLEIDAAYRNECIDVLLVEDPKRFRAGLLKLRALKKNMANGLRAQSREP